MSKRKLAHRQEERKPGSGGFYKVKQLRNREVWKVSVWGIQVGVFKGRHICEFSHVAYQINCKFSDLK